MSDLGYNIIVSLVGFVGLFFTMKADISNIGKTLREHAKNDNEQFNYIRARLDNLFDRK